MTRSTCHPWLDRFAWLTAAATFLLLGLGGLVTSHEAGLAVPDWPTTYGYNMFLFPMHLWQSNIFYEHTHRLLAFAGRVKPTRLTRLTPLTARQLGTPEDRDFAWEE
jgi:heme A synthase